MKARFRVARTMWLFGLVTSSLLTLGLGVLLVHRASALSYRYYDSANDITSGAIVRAAVGQTQYVQKTSVLLKAYFKTSQGGYINLFEANFCPYISGSPDYYQQGDAAYNNHPAIDTPITNFWINKPSTNSSGGTTTPTWQGKVENSSGACFGQTKSFRVSNPKYEPSLGYYSATIIVKPNDLFAGQWDGIMNFFAVESREPDGSHAMTAQVGGGTGYEVTVQQTNQSPTNPDYFIPFGSDCSVISNGSNRNIALYDLDNAGGSGAQLNGQITVQIYEAPTTVAASNSAVMSYNHVVYSGTPPSLNNATTNISFTPHVGMRYLLVLRNVYFNNTIQFGTPFDGIYFVNPCKPPSGTAQKGTSGLAQAACNYVSGYAYDPNNPGTKLAVKLYKNISGTYAYQQTTTANRTSSVSNPGGTSDYYLFSLPFQDVDYSSATYIVMAQDVGPTGSPTGQYYPIGGAVTVGPCVTASTVDCAGSTLPRSIALGTSVSFVTSMNFPSGAGTPTPPVSFNVQLYGPGGTLLKTWPWSNIVGSSTTVSTPTMTYTPTSAGTYALQWSFTTTFGGTTISKTCSQTNSGPGGPGTDTMTVSLDPYFSVVGGDIISQGDIKSWNSNTAPYAGSGSSLAVIAGGSAENFVSAQLGAFRGGAQVNPNSGALLGFANVGLNPGAHQYASSFAVSPAIPTVDTTHAVSIGTTSLVLPNGCSAACTFSVPAGTVVTGSVPVGVSVTVYAASGDITVGPGGIQYPANYTIGQVPRAVLYAADGNIIVDSSVTVTHGIYMAQSSDPADTSKGNFYSCGLSVSGVETAVLHGSANALQCTNQLTVYGSVAVDHSLILSRTVGNYGTPGNPPAETFYFSPEAWLYGVGVPSPSGSSTAPTFDSYYSLPPVL